MNKINQLLDPQFVNEYLDKKLPPLYPDFEKIESIKVIKHKSNIWQSTYHVVFEFRVSILKKSGVTETLPIFCSAHSSEDRRNAYNSLHFLWNHNFCTGNLSIPHPLFFSEYFNAVFYRGVEGYNLYYFIKKNDRPAIEDTTIKFAHWLAKLHAIGDGANFNQPNSRIKTVHPGTSHIFERIAHEHPGLSSIYKRIYADIVAKEDRFLDQAERLWLVHGDAHPENVIKMSDKKIGVIDFTDLCLSDFARDLGTFRQQVNYMIMRKIGDSHYAKNIQKLFLDAYLAEAGIDFTPGLEERIGNYYNWTCMRTATYFLIKSDPQPERAEPLIMEVCEKLQIR